MPRGDEHEFQWNIKGEPEPESVLDTMPSLQKEVEPRVRVGEYLVEMGSGLEQLQEAYLSADQRTRLATHLRAIYLYFQRLTAKEQDDQLRKAYADYLSIVGSIALIPSREGEQGERFTFLEALATNEIVAWAHHLYNAFHEIKENNGHGRGIEYLIDREVLSREVKARRELMSRLEEDQI